MQKQARTENRFLGCNVPHFKLFLTFAVWIVSIRNEALRILIDPSRMLHIKHI